MKVRLILQCEQGLTLDWLRRQRRNRMKQCVCAAPWAVTQDAGDQLARASFLAVTQLPDPITTYAFVSRTRKRIYSRRRLFVCMTP